MHLDEWAARWGIDPYALDDLRAMFTTMPCEPAPHPDVHSEAGVSNLIRLEASRKGCRLFRNNVGACMDDQGNHIRYGLANDSAKMNKAIKSSDLIGIRPVLVTETHVGCTIGQFVAREVKRANWKFKGDAHENAQLKFLQLVSGMGGDAQFANREGTL